MALEEIMKPTKSRGGKGWIIAGWIALAAAFVGALLPVVPQVPFAVLAAFFFSKGSPRLHHWLLNHKHFGATLRDWEMDRVVRVRTKVFATVMMIGGAGIAYWRLHENKPELALGIVGLFVVAILYVVTRRSKSRATDDSKDEFRMPART
jgi:uncharacterized membrane protein YbaN (DUF454 family)